MSLWLIVSLPIVVLLLPQCSESQMVKTNCTKHGLDISGISYKLTLGLLPNSVLIYSCPEGYYPYPVRTRSCRRNGEWSPAPMKRENLHCRMVTCPNPLVFENGRVHPSQTQYYTGNRTTYNCFDGYNFLGSKSRVCQPNGKWSGETPICNSGSERCPNPGVPAGSRRTGRHFDIDDEVTYRCDSGLILIGSQKRVCQENGQWTGIEPVCYYEHTYDTTEEVKKAFANSLTTSLTFPEDEEDVTQQGKHIRLDKSGNLNIYIAIDTSDSVREEDFENAKKCIMKLIEKIAYFEVTPKYDVIFFASTPTHVIDITSPDETQADVISEIEKYKYTDKGDKSGTNIAKVYSEISERIALIKARKGKDFKDIRNVIIIFTDGEANEGGNADAYVHEIKSAVYSAEGDKREDYLDMYAFGIGPEINDLELEKLVTKKDKEKHYFKLENIDSLEKTFDEMIDESDRVGMCGLHRPYATFAYEQREQYPWLAKITVTGERNCVGALVHKKYVLTAAHCFRLDDTVDKIVVDMKGIKRVKQFYIHPDFDVNRKKAEGIPEFYDYDVALIELKDYVSYSADLRPICIPCTKETSRALRLSDTETCQAQEQLLLKSDFEPANFRSEPQGEESIEKHATIKLNSKRYNCIKDSMKAKGTTNRNPEEIITNNFLCTGGIEERTDDLACKGDSGGPLYVSRHERIFQVGLVSWGVMNLCPEIKSREDSRDFHINLFRVQPFLRKYLAKADDEVPPIEFID